jgi:hypothetical protein
LHWPFFAQPYISVLRFFELLALAVGKVPRESSPISEVTAMTTPKEYRQYANEAMQSAERAATEDERRAFESLARKWTEAALAIERLNPRSEKPHAA